MTENGGAVYVLDPGSEILAAAPLYRDLPTPEDRLRALARAIAASPGFRDLESAVLVLRWAPPPRLALVGRFSEAERSRIESLPGILESGLRRLRYVSYEEAERVTRALAGRLESELGRDELSRCRFAPLPRGGLFVLGMLAYVLGLRADQIEVGLPASESEAPGGGPLVLVDDCALSGLRFTESLRRTTASEVVFAHLFSHPELRSALERREPKLRACVAGEDLTDLSHELLGEERDAWRERWLRRSDERACWIGLPEHVCFPWNEPDITVWNRTSASEEAPWRVVPPEHCLKNGMQGSARQARVQEQGPVAGMLQPGEHALVAHMDEGGEVLVADWKTRSAYRFSGIAADAWRALLSEGSEEKAVLRLERDWDADRETLRSDVRTVLERALELGLLKREARTEAGGRG